MDIESVAGLAAVAASRRTAVSGGTGFAVETPTETTRAAATEAGSGGLLGSVAGQVIQAGQEADEDAESSLPIGLRHYMEDIACDAKYAEEQARGLAYSTSAVFFNISDAPKNGDPAEVWMAFSAKMDAKTKIADAVQGKLREMYETESAQGIPPAQIYADMLKLKSSQSTEYMETQGETGLGVRRTLEDMLAALTKAMGRRGDTETASAE